jgi:Fe-S-cluster containining protein
MQKYAPLQRKLTVREVSRMKEIWDKVPPVSGCKGLCADSCTNVPVHPVEAYYLIERHGGELTKTLHPANDPDNPAAMEMPTLGSNFKPCMFLNQDRRCSIYEDRPLVCRLFGHHALTLRCVHGCKAEGVGDYEAGEFMIMMTAAFSGFRLEDDEDFWTAMKRTFDEMATED